MRKQERKKYTITIGIGGAGQKTGVTHLTIMLANYLASVKKCKVAVVDCSKGNALKVLQNLYDEYEREDDGEVLLAHFFEIHGVVYYSRMNQRDFATILHQEYDYILMDFGQMYPDACNYEILRCHTRILVGSCCEWEQEGFENLLECRKVSGELAGWHYAAFVGIREIREKFEKRYRIKIHRIPFEEDPFRLSRKHFDLLNNLLQEESECL